MIKQAKKWLGYKESNGTHKIIIDTYNSHRPLARGYKVQYNDQWCATFVSACAIKVKVDFPLECSCGKMIEKFQKLGKWVENDAYKPKTGDIIFYDWQDSGKGDNRGWSEHTGIVEKVSGKTITIIEGNYNSSVKRRYIKINDKFIRGYGIM